MVDALERDFCRNGREQSGPLCSLLSQRSTLRVEVGFFSSFYRFLMWLRFFRNVGLLILSLFCLKRGFPSSTLIEKM